MQQEDLTALRLFAKLLSLILSRYWKFEHNAGTDPIGPANCSFPNQIGTEKLFLDIQSMSLVFSEKNASLEESLF